MPAGSRFTLGIPHTTADFLFGIFFWKAVAVRGLRWLEFAIGVVDFAVMDEGFEGLELVN